VGGQHYAGATKSIGAGASNYHSLQQVNNTANNANTGAGPSAYCAQQQSDNEEEEELEVWGNPEDGNRQASAFLAQTLWGGQRHSQA
jgi:hypothetical protein